jgi:pimeloyl-ACP methyl ester carboxylesterase
VVVAAGLAGLVACGGDDDAGPGAEPPADEVPAADEPAAEDEPPTDGPVAVEEIEIAVDDAELGPLTFDALAAGDPDDELVLLLHGFPETSASYEDVLPELAAAGWYAVAPDQRGYSPGARPAAVEDYGVVQLVDDVVAFADELGADRFHLVGHDWGGGVAWATAAFHPDLVRSLTVLSTPHPNALADAYAAPGSEQPAMSSYVDLFRAPGSERTFLPRETFVAAFSSSGMPQEKAEAYADVLATEEALGAALNWYRATDFRQAPRLDPTTVPTTYVWGSDDLALGRTAAEGTGDHVEADYEFVELEGAGHWLPETEPARVTEAILARLAST